MRQDWTAEKRDPRDEVEGYPVLVRVPGGDHGITREQAERLSDSLRRALGRSGGISSDAVICAVWADFRGDLDHNFRCESPKGSSHHHSACDCGVRPLVSVLNALLRVGSYSAPSSVAVAGEVLEERARQEAKWGEQNHDPFAYLAILTEEVGELAQAALHTRYGGRAGGVAHMREEAVQAAAVALAIVECLDRGKWTWGGHALAGEASRADPREAQQDSKGVTRG